MLCGISGNVALVLNKRRADGSPYIKWLQDVLK